jgi:hypothetical protein
MVANSADKHDRNWLQTSMLALRMRYRSNINSSENHVNRTDVDEIFPLAFMARVTLYSVNGVASLHACHKVYLPPIKNVIIFVPLSYKSMSSARHLSVEDNCVLAAFLSTLM